MSPYIKLLVKLRIAAWNPIRYFGLEQNKRKKPATTIAILFSVAILAGYLIWMEVELFNAFVQFGAPETMLALVAVLCSLIMVFTSFFYVFSELFFAKDIQFVSALPIPSRQLLWAKLIRVWMGEALIALAICMPAAVLYGIYAGKGVLYYLSSAILSLIVPMLPIAVVTLISFVLIHISALWKHREKLTIAASVLFLLAVLWLQMSMSSSTSDDSMSAMAYQLVVSQNGLVNQITRIYPPARWFCGALSEGGFTAVLQWLGFAAVNIGGISLITLALGGRYQQLAIRQSEALVRADAGTKRNRGKQMERTPLQAMYRREVREIFTSPAYVMNCLATSIVLPILLIFAFLGQRGTSDELSAILPLLNTLPGTVVIAILTAAFAFESSMNMAIATSVSREGIRHEFYRTLPVKPQQILLSKLLMGLTMGAINSLPTAVVLIVFFPALWFYIIMGFLFSFLFTLCNVMIGLMLDCSHPKFGWKTETEAIKQNGMAALSMFGGMALIALLGFGFYWATQAGLSVSVAYLVVCAAMLLIDLLLLQRLSTKTAAMYIEKEVNL